MDFSGDIRDEKRLVANVHRKTATGAGSRTPAASVNRPLGGQNGMTKQRLSRQYVIANIAKNTSRFIPGVLIFIEPGIMTEANKTRTAAPIRVNDM